jgi:hypothetical protein
MRSRWSILALAALAIALILLGAALLGYFFLGREHPFDVPSWKDPMTLVQSDAIDPALAVAGLGGVSDADLVAQALSESRLGTAFAILVFSPSIDDRESAGDLLLLASRYARDGQNRESVQSYRLAGTIATLSPDLPDTMRAETFILAGEGLAELQEYGLAQLYLDQAYNIGTVSPYLQPAIRRTLFQRLFDAYNEIGDKERARESLEKSAESFSTVAVPDPPALLPTAQSPALSADIQQAEAERWQAGQELAAMLVSRGGNAQHETVTNLGNALVIEDAIRTPYFDAVLSQTPQVSTQISIVQARIDWLAIKYRVARKGYGISLVPEWETDVDVIRAELTKSYELLFALYADLIVAIPDADQIELASEEIIRREILAGELGRYPNYPKQQRIAELEDATAAIVASRPGSEMRVVVLPYGGVDSFVLVDDATFQAVTGK